MIAGRSPEARLFVAITILLTFAALWPIWALHLLPMQDYPQHLFLSEVLRTWDQPDLDWKAHYEVSLGLRPYMLWYLVMKPLAAVLGVQTAGRVVLSIYILLITVLVLGAQRRAAAGRVPWAALLLFPLAFNQMWFMGLSNYILSIPILFLAVLNLEAITNGAVTPVRIAGQGGLLVILLLDHPYSVLTYIGLSIAGAVAHFRDGRAILRTLLPAVAIGAIWGLWYVGVHSTAHQTLPWTITWWPFLSTLEYIAILFTGLQWHPHIDVLVLAVWVVVFIVLAPAVARWRAAEQPLRWPFMLFLAATAGVLVLPFWAGYYSYFNVRMLPVLYFAGALLLARLSVGPRAGAVVAGAAALLVGLSDNQQRHISAESEEVLAACAHVTKNASILPISFNATSNYLDKTFFYQLHSHEVSYCHFVAGGGSDPDLFPSSMLPVQYRPGVALPAPSNIKELESGRIFPHYDYLLARGAPAVFASFMSSQADLVAQSGHWQLFRNRSPPERAPFQN